MNAPASIPSEIVQVCEPTAPPESAQLVSDVENPEPVTSAVVPVPAELVFKVIDGETTAVVVSVAV